MNINYEHFMKADLRRYSGEWVVVVKGRVIAHAPAGRLKGIVQSARKRHPRQPLLIAMVPSEMEQIL